MAAKALGWCVGTSPLRSIAANVVGFFWGDDSDTAGPDAWCVECEQKLRGLNGASSEHWFRDAQFKVFCAKCWDEAKPSAADVRARTCDRGPGQGGSVANRNRDRPCLNIRPPRLTMNIDLTRRSLLHL